jgi:hypothetical protein
VPDSLCDIENMDCVDAQILCPQELHLLAQVLIHTTANQSGGYCESEVAFVNILI